MLSLVSAICIALAVYFWYNEKHSDSLSLNLNLKESIVKIRKKERKAQKGNVITLKSLKILGVPYTRYRILSFISGILVAFAWLYLAQNYLAAVVMFTVGFQLPGLWYERKASSMLDAQDRQVSIFVGTTADGLANGRTLNEALWQAALLMREEPMYSIAQNYLKKIGANVPIPEAIAEMAEEVNTPSFRFFADLVNTVKSVGTNGGNAFEVLDYKFHEEEDIQGDMRGEVSIWMGILVLFLGLTLAGPLFYRFFLPDIWRIVPRTMGWLIITSSVGTFIIFTALRRYSRYRVTL